MRDDLPILPFERREGQEPFHRSGKSAKTKLLDYWRWAVYPTYSATPSAVE